MRFSIFQDTVVGGRNLNQDRMGYAYTRDSLLLIVADGMGGHLRGEVAAELTLQAVSRLFQSTANPALSDPAGFLDHALHRAHRSILRYQEAHRLPESPRTTVVAAIVQHGHAWWAHAGDSRLYWLREGDVYLRTEDHSKVQSLLRMGLIRQEDIGVHPERNKVLNCLGSPYDPQIEISGAHALRGGDHLLLCSDGVWGVLDDAELIATIASGALRDAVPRLVRSAAINGGSTADNATALAVRWESLDSGIGLSSADLPDGAMTTTIAMAGDGDADDDGPTEEISEDEIERTIDEIRAAIERSAGR